MRKYLISKINLSDKLLIFLAVNYSIPFIINVKRLKYNNIRTIRNYVLMGADTKIMKGDIIEDGSVIGTGAIVTGFVNQNSIYVGIPAKKVSDNIYWERERK